MKVFMVPSPRANDTPESGIRRVIEAYKRYLSPMGVEFVANPDGCDLAAIHAGSCEPLGIPTVSHVHGLYWTADYPASKWEWKVNSDVVSVIHSASAVTVPSQWVAEVFQRDMRFTPTVVPHGIEWEDWQHNFKGGEYILWNKNRTGDVCDVAPIARLSSLNTGMNFVSTFMPSIARPNIKATGILPHARMKRIIQQAGVYLATTKETFGIGILEAMAGVWLKHDRTTPGLSRAQGATHSRGENALPLPQAARTDEESEEGRTEDWEGGRVSFSYATAPRRMQA